MANSIIRTGSVGNNAALGRIAPTATTNAPTRLDTMFSAINSDVTPLLELKASTPASLVLNIGPIAVANAVSGLNKIIPPISNLIPTFTSGTVTFPSTSGGNAVPSAGSSLVITIPSGQFLKVGISLNAAGNLVLNAGTPAATLSTATAPSSVASTFSIGYVVLQNVGGTIQNIASSAVYQYVGGGSGGSSSSSSVGINYITDGDFEATQNGQTPSGWLAYADAAGLAPVDGFGGSPNANVTFQGSVSAPLRGNISALFTKDAANRQGTGWAKDFSISVIDTNKKLQISLDMSVASGTYAAGDVRLYIYDVTNAQIITPSSTPNLPSATTNWQVRFDSTNSQSYRLILHISSTSTAAYALKLDSISVDPGVIGQVPAVGPVALTPVWFNTTGLTISQSLTYDRAGEELILNGFVAFTGTGSSGSNLQLGFNEIALADGQYGSVSVQQNNNLAHTYLSSTTAGRIQFLTENTGAAQTNIPGTAFGNTGTLPIKFLYFKNLVIKVATWQGSGTVNLGAGAQPSYASNSNVTTASDTTSFQYGEEGALVQAFAPSGLTAVNKRVRSPYPNPKFASLQVKVNGVGWVPVGGSTYGFTSNGTPQAFGMALTPINSTDYDVGFFSKPVEGSAGTWSGENSAGTRWRVVFADTPAAVGFGLATATDSGLVSGNLGIPGNNTGTGIAAGKLGETIYASPSNTTFGTTGTAFNFVTLSLTPGEWMVYLKYASGTSGTPQTIQEASISLTSATPHTKSLIRDTSSSASGRYSGTTTRRVSLPSSQTLYAVMTVTYAGVAGTTDATGTEFYAVRVG